MGTNLLLPSLGLLLALAGDLGADDQRPNASHGSETPKGSPTHPLARDLDTLVRMKVISSVAYWLENAAPGRQCDGVRVAELLMNTAKALQPVTTFDQTSTC